MEIPDLAEGGFEKLTVPGQLEVVERAAGGGPVVLIGSSLGGYLAALYAARHAEVERVVLMAPAFGFPKRWPVSLGEAAMRGWRESGWLEVFHYGENRKARIGYGLYEDGLRYEDYPEVRQPCLVLHGVRDTVVPVEYSRAFAAGRENVALREYDAGHELTEVLEPMWEEVRGFLGLV